MKIAFLGPAPPLRGGISQFALDLAKEYLAQGHQVCMFGFRRQYPALIFPGASQTGNFTGLEGIKFANFATPYLPHTWHSAYQAMRDYDADVIILSYFLPFFAPYYAWILGKLQHPRVICLAHNVRSHEAWPGADTLARMVFRRCARIVVLSRQSMRDIQQLLPGKVHKVTLGFHPVYATYGSSYDIPLRDFSQPKLLFFGLIKPYKGLDLLLKAMPLILKEMPQARLTIAGEVYGKPAVYTNLIRHLGIEHAVKREFRFVDDSEIAGFFHEATLCVLPYKSATQSGVIAVANAFGLPVLATDVGGLGEYIDPGSDGLLVPPDNPSAIAEAVLGYYREGMGAPMSERAKAKAGRYTWSGLAELVLAK